jgi:hypothetical protein
MKMFTYQQQINVCMHEALRFRVAIKDQLAATNATREGFEAAIEQGRSFWESHVRGQALTEHDLDMKLREWTSVEFGRLKTALQLWLVVTNGLHKMARKLREMTTERPVNSCVQKAIAEFESSAPNAELMRHIHEHLDEYALGGGRDRDKFPVEHEGGSINLPEGDVVFEFGGLFLSVNETTEAAMQLSKDLQECMKASEKPVYEV